MAHNRRKKFYGSVTVSERGQVVIPAQARKDFGIEAGEKLLVLGHSDGDDQIDADDDGRVDRSAGWLGEKDRSGLRLGADHERQEHHQHVWHGDDGGAVLRHRDGLLQFQQRPVLVLLGDAGNLFQQLPAVNGPCRIIRINQDNSTGAGGN